MSPSSQQTTRPRAVLCQRTDELAEFAPLLTDLGLSVESRTGDLPSADDLAGVQLVIVAGRRLTEGRAPAVQRWPRTIAVVDDGSKTLAAHLNRVGVAMVIRRPIHPRTLQLLMLHELYRGPERRNKKRVPIGHPIRAGVGLFKQNATLLELSRSGARIALANPPKVGTLIQFVIGKELTHAKPIKIQAKVVRSIRSTNVSRRNEGEIGLSIVNAAGLARPIQAILDRFASGPASLGAAPRSASETSAARVGPAPSPAPLRAPQPGTPSSSEARRLPPSHQPDSANAKVGIRSLPPAHVGAPDGPPTCASIPAVAAAAESASHTAESMSAPELERPMQGTSFDAVDTEIEILESDIDLLEDDGAGDDVELELDEEICPAPGAPPSKPADRRQSARVPYAQRVVALGDQAARVVVGRDLCVGGMRIAANPAIALGDVLRIALHAGTETEPLVVLAGVERDDGDGGLVLAFAELTAGQRDRLEKIISASSSIQGPRERGEEGESLVVGELLARVARGHATA